jgi:50S ribosomal subunit-associated GTPase HflX
MELSLLPELVVLNKCDVASPDAVAQLLNELGGVAVSAAKRQGIGALLAQIDVRLIEPRGDNCGSSLRDRNG